MIEHFAAFLGVSAVIIVTPGPDTALTIRNTLLGGRRAGVATAFGVSAGQAVWTLASAAGVVVLLLASEPLFAAVRIAGAIYLAFLGAQALRGAVRGAKSGLPAEHGPGGPGLAPAAALRQGVFSNLANPKMAVFFTSLLPQFARGGEGTFAALLVLGLVFCAMTLVWLAAYATFVARAGDVLRRSGLHRALEGAMGVLLVAFGLRLAAQQR